MLSVHATDGVQVLLAGFLEKSSKAFPKQQAEISENGRQTPRPGNPKGLGLWPCYSALEFLGLDVVEARHRPCVGAPFADPHDVCPRRRWVQAVRDDACDRAVVGGI